MSIAIGTTGVIGSGKSIWKAAAVREDGAVSFTKGEGASYLLPADLLGKFKPTLGVAGAKALQQVSIETVAAAVDAHGIDHLDDISGRCACGWPVPEGKNPARSLKAHIAGEFRKAAKVSA